MEYIATSGRAPSHTFHWADYLVFSASLAVGIVIGIVTYVREKRALKHSKKGYLMGGGDMNFIAVGISNMLSSFNAVFFLGGTAEVHYRGAIYGLLGVAVFCNIIHIIAFIPAWRQQNVTTINEYLEQRFGSFILRLLIASLNMFSTLIYLSLVLYTPAFTLSTVMGINYNVSVVTCGLICALYTTIGGLKAVVWTDVMQGAILMLGILTLLFMGHARVGSPAELFNTANDLGRLNFGNFSPDPRERHTVWTFLIGLSISYTVSGGVGQNTYQRLKSVKTLGQAIGNNIVGALVIWTFLAIVVTMGLVTSAYYKDCDPLVSGDIAFPDQLLPYFAMEMMGSYPGLPGLFIAALFAAALSTVSSQVNSRAAVFFEDFIKPIAVFIKRPLPDSWEYPCLVLLSAVLGVSALGLSYIAPSLGPAIVQIPVLLSGAIDGPAAVPFIFGFFIPWTNKWGALFGTLIGFGVNFWISYGSITYGKGVAEYMLPLGDCLNTSVADRNQSTLVTQLYTTQTPNQAGTDELALQGLYDISYHWIGFIGISTSIISGLLISCCSNRLGYGQDIDAIEPRLLYTVDRWKDLDWGKVNEEEKIKQDVNDFMNKNTNKAFIPTCDEDTKI